MNKGLTMLQSTAIVVTEVSSSIGLAAAEKFAERGCKVFSTVRNIAEAPTLHGVQLVEMDVRSTASVQSGIGSIVAKVGKSAC
jgi:NAD(P)-dependent dehydrogenase (short-subunit alcohol dehydrogenase family)